MVPLGAKFSFLPETVDIGFVGTGTALGAIVLGLIAWVRVKPASAILQDAGLGGLVGGIVALIIWLAGISGVEFN